MRALLVAILLLSTAVPAVAQGQPGDAREPVMEGVRENRAERQQQRQERQEQRQERQQQLQEQRQEQLQEQRQEQREDRRAERAERMPITDAGTADVRASQRRMERLETGPRASAEQQPVLRNDNRAEALGRVGRQPRGERMDERWRDSRRAAERTRQVDTVTTWRQDRRNRTARTPGVVTNGWREGWRRDNRYDWQRYRDRNRSQFRLGIYVDPFGWGYRQIGYGSRLDNRYYSGRYALNDPWTYRLPLAPPGYRWIRYYDDALLVDVRYGEVVDVIRDFFW